MTAEISTMRLDIGDIQEALKNHDSWMEDVSNTLQQMQEKEENLTEDIINLKNEMNTKLDTKVDNVAWKDVVAALLLLRCCCCCWRHQQSAACRKPTMIWMPRSRLSVTWSPLFASTWMPAAERWMRSSQPSGTTSQPSRQTWRSRLSRAWLPICARERESR